MGHRELKLLRQRGGVWRCVAALAQCIASQSCRIAHVVLLRLGSGCALTVVDAVPRRVLEAVIVGRPIQVLQPAAAQRVITDCSGG